jgi:phosphotransferase system  glucose/maltose/N-acetylglucosamine-specific IIC component
MPPLAVGFWVFGFGILGLLAFVCWVVGLVDILRRDDLDTRQRTAWILIVVLVPIIGTIYYFVRRPTTEPEREKLFRDQTARH